MSACIVIMGVAGAGKSTIGPLLAAELGWTFVDADSFHPAANIEKMAHGIPLNDADRAPWLAALHERVAKAFNAQENVVLGCSALKQRYRDVLAQGFKITWVYLRGSIEQIRQRLLARQHHFMSAEMLASQFADLEEPTGAIVVDVALSPNAAVRLILDTIAQETQVDRARKNRLFTGS